MTQKIRRINLYAGPGCGKTTTCAGLFYFLKRAAVESRHDLKIEHIQEYIKSWSYMGRKPVGFAQTYVFAKQMHREEVPLTHGVDVVVTDSPLLLGCTYAKKYNNPGWQNLLNIEAEFEKAYPSLHIMLDRGDRPYVASGRYESEEKAREMDTQIEDMLASRYQYIKISYQNFGLIRNVVFTALNLPPYEEPSCSPSF
jgi:hypothetical protein